MEPGGTGTGVQQRGGAPGAACISSQPVSGDLPAGSCTCPPLPCPVPPRHALPQRFNAWIDKQRAGSPQTGLAVYPEVGLWGLLHDARESGSVMSWWHQRCAKMKRRAPPTVSLTHLCCQCAGPSLHAGRVAAAQARHAALRIQPQAAGAGACAGRWELEVGFLDTVRCLLGTL